MAGGQGLEIPFDQVTLDRSLSHLISRDSLVYPRVTNGITLCLAYLELFFFFFFFSIASLPLRALSHYRLTSIPSRQKSLDLETPPLLR